MEENNKLGTQKVGKLLFSLALPTITAQMVNMLYNIIDRIYIGHIKDVGALALTGLGVCFPIIMLVSAFASLVGMGGAPQVSMKMGRGDKEGAEKTLGNCFVVLAVVAVILTVTFRTFGSEFLRMFGASEDTLGYALSYMNIYVLGSFFVMMTLGMNLFITAQGFSKISMMTTLIGAALNIILDPIFIFVLGMGVQGAALATILSQGVSMVWVLRFLMGKKTVLRLKVSNFKLEKNIILPVLALGLSPFIMQSTESLLNICFNTSLQKYGGDMAVGAMTIMSSVMQFVSLPTQGLAQGAQPIISYNYGAGNMRRVKQTFWLLFAVAEIYTVVFWIFNMTFPRVFPGIFAGDGELLNMAAWAIRIYLAAGFTSGVQFACQQTFIALGEAKISLFLALLRKIILLIPLIYILPNFFEDKVFAVFAAEPVADVLAAATTFCLFMFRFRQLSGNRQPETVSKGS